MILGVTYLNCMYVSIDMYSIRRESVCSITMIKIILKMKLNQEPETSNQQLPAAFLAEASEKAEFFDK